MFRCLYLDADKGMLTRMSESAKAYVERRIVRPVILADHRVICD